MVTKIDRELAEQIVNTIKDVCDHDINFIAPSGIILASTDPSRVGTFHEIGQQAADSGSVLEVTEDNNFSGTNRESIFHFIIMNICWPSSESPVYLIKSAVMPISQNVSPIFWFASRNWINTAADKLIKAFCHSVFDQKWNRQSGIPHLLPAWIQDWSQHKEKNCSYSHKQTEYNYKPFYFRTENSTNVCTGTCLSSHI